MNLLSRFEAFVAKHDLLTRAQPVVVGVSGGVDSVVLLRLLVVSGYQPVAVHVNYGLRGPASDADEALVRDLCAAWDVPHHVERAALDAGNVQAEARNVRYQAFRSVAEEVGAQAVATAHHLNDRAETLLLHLFRGTGPTGLTGMPLRRPFALDLDIEIVRPLLFASRKEIEAYATEHDVPWREDASNHEGDYRRTALRKTILPAIEEVFGDAVQKHLASTADLMRDYLDSGAALVHGSTLANLTKRTDEGRALSVAALRDHPVVVRHGLYLEALRRWAPDAPRTSAALWAIDGLLDAQPGRRIPWPGLVTWRDREHIVFATRPPEALKPVPVALGATRTVTGTLHAELFEPPEDFERSAFVEYVDAERLRFPLTLRPWQEGDAFQPLGMEGRKNVSDLLTDRKVPPQRRAQQLVLANGDEIVWVVGHRLAEAYRVHAGTRRVLRLEWTPTKEVDGEEGAA